MIWLISDVKMLMRGKNQIQIQLPPLSNCDLRFAIRKMRLTVSRSHVAVGLQRARVCGNDICVQLLPGPKVTRQGHVELASQPTYALLLPFST